MAARSVEAGAGLVSPHPHGHSASLLSLFTIFAGRFQGQDLVSVETNRKCVVGWNVCNFIICVQSSSPIITVMGDVSSDMSWVWSPSVLWVWSSGVSFED